MAGTKSRRQDADYESDRQFLLMLPSFIDALPQTPTTVVGEGRPDGTLEYREVSTVAPNLSAGLTESLAELEARGAAAARAGLRAALQDLLEMTRDLAPAQVRAADARLEAAGILTQLSRAVYYFSA